MPTNYTTFIKAPEILCGPTCYFVPRCSFNNVYSKWYLEWYLLASVPGNFSLCRHVAWHYIYPIWSASVHYSSCYHQGLFRAKRFVNLLSLTASDVWTTPWFHFRRGSYLWYFRFVWSWDPGSHPKHGTEKFGRGRLGGRVQLNIFSGPGLRLAGHSAFSLHTGSSSEQPTPYARKLSLSPMSPDT